MKWFKHDSDANADAKIQNVLLDYGLEGYGLYWYCIELIVLKVDEDNINFDLEHDARIIARNTGSTPQKVSEMMAYFVKVGLFENSDGVITCLKLAKRLDKSMTSNNKMRELIGAIKSGDGHAQAQLPLDSHDSIMIKSDLVMQEEKRREEIRRDKNKDKYESLALKLDVDIKLIKRIVKHRNDIKKPANTDKKILLVINDFKRCVEEGLFETLDQAMDRLDNSQWQTVKPDYIQGENGKVAKTNQPVKLDSMGDNELFKLAESMGIYTDGKNRWALIDAIRSKQA